MVERMYERSLCAISLVDIDRGSGNYGVLKVANVNVHDNVIRMTGGNIGLVGRPSAFTANNRFLHNTYYLQSLSGTYFTWQSGNLDKEGWKSVGNDATGSFLQ